MRFSYLNYINWHSGALASGRAGVKFGADSTRYIDGAERILSNQSLHSDQTRYIGYIIFLALTLKLKCGFIFAVVLQLLLALIAALAIYDIGKSISGSRFTGILAAGLFLSNPFIVNWHSYIHSDTLYFSFLIFSAWSIFKSIETQKWNYYLFACLIVLITATVRPNGWVLIPIMLCSYFLLARIKVVLKVGIAILVFILFVVFARNFSVSESANKDIEFVKLMQTGVIVWGHSDLRLNMPEANKLEGKHWSQSIPYILSHPVAVAHLAYARITAEYLQMYRPWSSFKFKARFLLWMVPVYIFAIIGVILLRKNIGIRFIAVVLFSQMFIIAATCSEHECRYMLSTMSLIYLLAACGMHATFARYVLKSTVHV